MKNLDVALRDLHIFPSVPSHLNASTLWMGDHNLTSDLLIYVTDGSFVLHVDEQSYIVKKHQMALFPAHHPHTFWKVMHQPLSFLSFSFKAECHGESLFEFFGLADDHHVVDLPPEPVWQCYQQMHAPQTIHDNAPLRLNLAILHAQLCLMYVQARLSAQQAKQDYADIIDYLRAHITEDVSLNELASLFHFEPTYFSKKFKQQMGVSPMRYFAQMRAKYAANLLKTTDMPVKKVADAAGFHDYYYFKSFFARHMGVSPEHYKEIFVRPAELRFS